jgi:hypothetical protein
VAAIGRKFSGPCGGWKASTNIARVLTKLVHLAAFCPIQIFRQESRKSNAAMDYRWLLFGIPKTTFGVRIPVRRCQGHGQRVDSNSAIRNHGRGRLTPMITPTLLRWRPRDESSAGILYAGISEKAVGKTAVLAE